MVIIPGENNEMEKEELQFSIRLVMFLFVFQSIVCMQLFDRWMFEQLHQVDDQGCFLFEQIVIFSIQIAFRYALIIGKIICMS